MAVVEGAGEVGLEVVVVEEGAFLDSVEGVADGEAVLDDVLAFGMVLEGAFVAGWDVGEEGEGVAVDVELHAFGEGLEGYEDGVGGVDAEVLFHEGGVLLPHGMGKRQKGEMGGCYRMDLTVSRMPYS